MPTPARRRARPRGPHPLDLLDRIAEGLHHEPHAVLGAHPAGDGSVVRCLEPRAEAVEVIVDGERFPMERIHAGGIWEAAVPRRPPFPYRYEVRGAWGVSVRDDPYRFLPTLGDQDLHYIGEGTHFHLHRRLGAHRRVIDGVEGWSFAVWAPNARAVRVVGDWNSWDRRIHPLRSLGSSGVWEVFLPGLRPGAKYKFAIRNVHGDETLKADPFAFRTEVRPANAAVLHDLGAYRWGDDAWLRDRAAADPHRRPISIYEMHIGSWRRHADGRWFTYRELADPLIEYVHRMGFTHVEFLPVMEHPLDASWGYQVTGYFAPSARWGSPDDLKYLIDRLHQAGIGVLLDWVPAHFPRDDWALARFDGTALYEHEDPRQGAHPDWGTLIFNYGRREVRNFLLSSALFWLEEYHADGLRTDAVASMLYLDYSRAPGEWVPNIYGGRENLEAIRFLRDSNKAIYRGHPGVFTVAEESTAWPGVSRPVHLGGLGFGFKWNMGWMHDVLQYFRKDPIHRRFHHGNLTFAMYYAFHENFVLSLSHDEVVHGKRSLLRKMPGDDWQRFANLRALYGYMWTNPGKKLLFMGGEFGQRREWGHERELDWHLLDQGWHEALRRYVADLNRLYRQTPALHDLDGDPRGFEWIDYHDADMSVVSYIRRAENADDFVVCVFNFTPVPRWDYRIGVPRPGFYREVLNSDSEIYGGSNMGNAGGEWAEERRRHGRPWSVALLLPPLSALVLRPA